MAMRRLIGVAATAVLTILRLLWRLRSLVLLVLLVLLIQHMYCRSTAPTPDTVPPGPEEKSRKPPGKLNPCPDVPNCTGSASVDAGLQ